MSVPELRTMIYLLFITHRLMRHLTVRSKNFKQDGGSYGMEQGGRTDTSLAPLYPKMAPVAATHCSPIAAVRKRKQTRVFSCF
jgi:hypothetical protein